MASRPEAAYAATEVTPKWVLISWHHLLSPSVIILGDATLVKGVTVDEDDVGHLRSRSGYPRRCPSGAGPFRLAPHIRGAGNAVLRRGDRRRIVRHGLGFGGRRA